MGEIPLYGAACPYSRVAHAGAEATLLRYSLISQALIVIKVSLFGQILTTYFLAE